VLTPEGILTPAGVTPRLRQFRVVGIFKLGFFEFDSNYALIPLPIALEFLSRPGPDVMQLKVTDLQEAPAISARLQDLLGPAYITEDWTLVNSSLYSALRLEKYAIALTIGLIVMVAALNIVASLVLLVMEKSRDIGILKTMGTSPRRISVVFMMQGTIIGLVGTLAGAIVAVVLCWVLTEYRLVTIPQDIYQVAYVPFIVKPQDFATVVVSAIVICFLATIYPSRQAAKLDPVQALRFE
jgi:lipoprotein-releasing system permease protein